MSDQNFSPQESLKLIQSMIDRTRKDISDNSINFLVWGWITLIATTGQFILKHIYNYEKHYIVWVLVIPGIIFSYWWGYREGKRSKVTTYVGESLKHLWLGMSIAYFVLSMILTVFGWGLIVFPFFIMLYGLGSFVSGSIIKFKPLVVGGFIASGLAIGAACVPYDYQMLFGAASILVSYIIPAYMLRFRNKHSKE